MDVRTGAPQSVTMQVTIESPTNEAGLHDVLTGLACQPVEMPSSTTSELPAAPPLAPLSGSLQDASTSRLVCLLRHWKWADEALAQFDTERAIALERNVGATDVNPAGGYHRWCALLCGFSEAALEQGLLPGWQLDTLRSDLEASLAELRSSRQLFVEIPASLHEHPPVAKDDGQALARLRRLHHAFGTALRDEQASRELELLLFEH